MAMIRTFFVVLSMFVASSAAAQDRAQLREAQQYFEEGVRFSDAQRWGEAVELFRRSLAITERPSTLYNLGLALFRMGGIGEARTTLERFVELARAANDSTLAENIAEAERMLAEMSQAQLRLVIDPPDAVLLIDGNPLPGEGSPREVALDPGTHVLLVEAPGHVRQRLEVSVLGGATLEREVRLVRERERPPIVIVQRADAPPPTDIASEPGLWIGVGVGVAVLAAIAITLGVVLGQDPLTNYNGTSGIVIELPE